MFQFFNGFLVITLITLWSAIHADVFEECADKNNVYLATNESCSKYIYCDGEESIIGECETDTPYFSEIDQTCDADRSVCKTLEEGSTTTIAGNLSSTSSTVVTPETTTMANLNNTNNTTTSSSLGISPTGSSSTTATIGTTTTVSVPINTSMSVTYTTVIPTSTVANNVASQCPSIDDPNHIVFLPHTKSCADYFMCYHGQPMAMHCSNMLHFDAKTQKCDYPEVVQCQLESATPREKCQSHTVDVYAYPHNCNYFYSCRLGYLMVMQCPLNMNWDYEKKACRMRQNAKCYHQNNAGNGRIIM